MEASEALLEKVGRRYAFERIFQGGKDGKTCEFAGCGMTVFMGGGERVGAAGGAGGKRHAGPRAGCGIQWSGFVKRGVARYEKNMVGAAEKP